MTKTFYEGRYVTVLDQPYRPDEPWVNYKVGRRVPVLTFEHIAAQFLTRSFWDRGVRFGEDPDRPNSTTVVGIVLAGREDGINKTSPEMQPVCLGLDLDQPGVPELDVLSRMLPWAHFVKESYGSRPDRRKYHLFLATSMVLPDRDVWRAVKAHVLRTVPALAAWVDPGAGSMINPWPVPQASAAFRFVDECEARCPVRDRVDHRCRGAVDVGAIIDAMPAARETRTRRSAADRVANDDEESERGEWTEAGRRTVRMHAERAVRAAINRYVAIRPGAGQRHLGALRMGAWIGHIVGGLWEVGLVDAEAIDGYRGRIEAAVVFQADRYTGGARDEAATDSRDAALSAYDVALDQPDDEIVKLAMSIRLQARRKQKQF